MIQINTKLRKWGNSFGIVVPLNKISREHMKEGEEVKVFLAKKKKQNILRETFGTFKFKKSTAQMMKEIDEELYDDW